MEGILLHVNSAMRALGSTPLSLTIALLRAIKDGTIDNDYELYCSTVADILKYIMDFSKNVSEQKAFILDFIVVRQKLETLRIVGYEVVNRGRREGDDASRQGRRGDIAGWQTQLTFLIDMYDRTIESLKFLSDPL